jgi:hypothetical protein
MNLLLVILDVAGAIAVGFATGNPWWGVAAFCVLLPWKRN